MSIIQSSWWRSVGRLLVAWLLLAGLALAAIALEQPSGHMTGMVLDQRGKPLARAKVVVTGRVTRATYAQPNGQFRFSHLPVGDYYVSARARGHEPQHQEDWLSVKEGETLAQVDFKLARTAPSIDVANAQRVFLPGKPVRINARGNQLDALDVAVYRLDWAPLLREDAKLSALRGRADVQALQRRGALKPSRRWQVPVRRVSNTDDDWFFQPVQVENLPPGNYLVSVGGQPGPDPDGKPQARVEDTWWFQVSETAVVTKRTQDTLLAWVTNLATKRPISGARLHVYGAGRARIGLSDANGLIQFSLPPGTEGVTVTAEHQGSWAIAQAGYWGDPRTLDIYAYTERPLYRRGQTVHVKALARRRVGDQFKAVPGQTLAAVLRDARGEIVAERALALSADSSADWDFQLSTEAALGEYRVELTGAGSYQSVPFQVADYRKPEYKVEVLPQKPSWSKGETARVKLRAGYFFGAPVVDARLVVTVYSAPAWGRVQSEAESFYAGFTDEGAGSYWGLGDVVMQHEARSDAQGEAEFDIALPAAASGAEEDIEGDRQFTVVVEASDDSGRPVKSQAAFQVVQADVRLVLSADKTLYSKGQPLTLGLELTDQAGQRKAWPVDVTVYRLEQDRKTSPQGDEYYETRRVKVASQALRTDAQGLARLTLPAAQEGHFEIVALAKDARGRAVQDRAIAWVAGEGEEGSTYRYGGLQILLDKTVYRPGERAKAMVISPEPDVAVLLTEEGRGITRPRVMQFKGTTAVFEVVVQERHKPNAWLAATVVNGLELLTTERSLNVLPEDKFLNIEVAADVPQAKPGQRVTYTITARDWRGQPVDADVSLGVVDEAIYALEADRTPDIRGFFHGPRWNRVEMAYSFAEDYSGGLDKFAPDPRVRAQFKDTAAWFPRLRTGPSGTTSVTFTLPDNLTTWVATVRGATGDTRVGAQSHRLVATQELLLRLEPPRFLVAGDEVDLVAIAHNYTNQPVEAELGLQARGGITLGRSAAQRVVLPPGGLARARWRGQATTVGEAELEATLRPRKPVLVGDAVRRTLPVTPRSVEEFTPVVLGASTDTPGSTTLQIPADALPGAVLQAQLQTTPLGALEGSLDYLLGYPYGCVEQTLARCAPAAVVLPRLQRAGVSDTWLIPRQRQANKDLANQVQRLFSLQQADGGWGWWLQDVSRPELTAYVLLYMAEARDAGVSLPARALDLAVRRVGQDVAGTDAHAVSARQVQRWKGPDLRAQGLLALARWQRFPRLEIERLWQARAALSPQARAQFILALQAAGQGARAREELEVLMASAQQTETYVHWLGGERTSWHDSPTEATAWGLLALLSLEPHSAQANKAARWLMSRNARGHWEHTRATTAAAWALSEWWRAQPDRQGQRGVATLTLGDRAVETWEQNTASEALSPPVWQIPLEGRSQTLQLNLTAPRPLTWDLTGGIVYRREATALRAQGSHGLSLEREYYRLPQDLAARARGAGLDNYFQDNRVRSLSVLSGNAQPGEPILVRLKLKAEQPGRWMCLVDPLPAGCEVLDNVPENWSFWWSHQEARDQEMAFFFSELPSGERSLYYVMRATSNGRYHALPPQAWAMYDPEMRARGALTMFDIAE